MELKKDRVLSLLIGFLVGAVLTFLIIFGLAAISLLKEGKRMAPGGAGKMIPGYLDDALVSITKDPKKGYDWSLDVLRQGNYLIQLGKRTEADGPDRCQVFDLQNKLLIYMVWDDPEAEPGFLLYNNQRELLASLVLSKERDERDFWYGPYGSSSEKKPQGIKAGFKDLDCDGQFDWQHIFNNGEIQHAFIWIEGGWLETTEFNSKETTALIRQGDDTITYIFQPKHGWQQEQ